MKKKFDKPVCETISFGYDVIATSGCCDVLGEVMPTNETCNHNPECVCQVNHDPAVANCI